MVPLLYNTPKSASEWAQFSFANKTSHRRIVSAIAAKGTVLPLQDIDPINPSNIGDWLERHQILHNNFNQFLKLPSGDLRSVDFEDESQLTSWIAIHAREHRDAERAALQP